MKKPILIGIIMAIYIALSGIADLGLSYMAYQRDALFFIDHEVNREIVDYFVKGNFPYIFLLFYIVVIAYVCLIAVPLFYRADEYPELKKTLFNGTIAVLILAGLCHYVGGLSWFFIPLSYVVIFLQIGTTIVSVYIVISITKYVINKYKKEKEIHKS